MNKAIVCDKAPGAIGPYSQAVEANGFISLANNFITYARRAEEVFNESDILENKIHNQIKRHWNNINKRLNK